MKQSLIYKNIGLYRFLMNGLYLGGYRRRFEKVVSLIRGDASKVVELCFGDTWIAEHCQKRGIEWIGYDLNEAFVTRAQRLKLNAVREDVAKLDEFPQCDACIMVGSLYHFQEGAPELIRKMIRSAKQVILSEPVRNLSSAKGIVGFVARRSADAGKGRELFRFNETTFIDMMNTLNVPYRVVSLERDILIEIRG
jgi:hypothetical protein